MQLAPRIDDPHRQLHTKSVATHTFVTLLAAPFVLAVAAAMARVIPPRASGQHRTVIGIRSVRAGRDEEQSIPSSVSLPCADSAASPAILVGAVLV